MVGRFHLRVNAKISVLNQCFGAVETVKMPILRDNRPRSGTGDEYSSWVSSSLIQIDSKENFQINSSQKLELILYLSGSKIGLVFLFNLIVGTGALTLPSAFAKTGWLLGLILITILGFISYMTVTFVIETMACANAIYYWGRLEQLKREREREGVSYFITSNIE